MRKIVQKELSLKIPVIVYVSPGGARAASAGVWISEAADMLAMAPETNIGSSTPIDSSGSEHRQRPAAQGDQRRRRVAARAREVARPQREMGRQRRPRRVEPHRSSEALSMHVIDLISPTLPALLTEIDGRTTVPRHFTLHTSGRRRS